MAQADARKEAEAVPNVPLVPGLPPDVSPALTALSGLGADPAAYIIYQDVMRGRQAEPALLQYDIDEQDGKVLAEVNAGLQRAAGNAAKRHSSGGAARPPPATRSSSAAAAAALAAQLDEDSYEALIGVLERAHFQALQQRKELWQAEVKAGKVPKLPPADKILPWEQAVAAARSHQPPLPPLPRALYNRWLKRRKQEGGPLLGYLWYEQPWKAICFQERRPGQEGQQGDMPFMVTETKNSTRAGWSRVRMDKKEAYDRLFEVREELELLRTMADQVRKRERLKKQLLKLYRAEMCAKLGLHLHAHSKHPHTAAAGAVAGPAVPAAGAAPARQPGTGASGRPTASAPAAAGTAGRAGAPAAVAAASAGAHTQPPKKRRRLASEPAEERAQSRPAGAQADEPSQAEQQVASRGRQQASGRPPRKVRDATQAGPSSGPSSAPAAAPPKASEAGPAEDSEPDSSPPPRRGRSATLRQRPGQVPQRAHGSSAQRRGAVIAGSSAAPASDGGAASQGTNSSSLPSSSLEGQSGDKSSSSDLSSGDGDEELESSGQGGSVQPSSSGESGDSSGGGGPSSPSSDGDASSEDSDGGPARSKRGSGMARGRSIDRGRGRPGLRASMDDKGAEEEERARSRSASRLGLRKRAASSSVRVAAKPRTAVVPEASGAGVGSRTAAQQVGRAAVQRAVARKRLAANAAVPAAACAAADASAVAAVTRLGGGADARSLAKAGGGRGGAPGTAEAPGKAQNVRGRAAARTAAPAPAMRSSPSHSSPTRSDPDRPSSSSSPERSRSPPGVGTAGRGRLSSRSGRPRAFSRKKAGPISGGAAGKQPEASGQASRDQGQQGGEGTERGRMRFANRSVSAARNSKDGRSSSRQVRGAKPKGCRELASLLRPPRSVRFASVAAELAAGAGALPEPSEQQERPDASASARSKGVGRGRSSFTGRSSKAGDTCARAGAGAETGAVLEAGGQPTDAPAAEGGKGRRVGAGGRGSGGPLSRQKRVALDTATAGAAGATGARASASKLPVSDAGKGGSTLRKVREGGVTKVFTRKVPLLLRERNGSTVARLSAAGAGEKSSGHGKG